MMCVEIPLLNEQAGLTKRAKEVMLGFAVFCAFRLKFWA
jgi:hypothetical protein